MISGYCIVDSRLDDACRNSLFDLGYELIPLPPFRALDAPVASHPDMVLNLIKDKLFVHRDYYFQNCDVIDFICDVSNAKAVICDDSVGHKYPKDIIFNSFVFKSHFVGKLDAVSEKLLHFAKKDGCQTVNIKQGYAKCSVCLANDFIVTADSGIVRALSGVGDILPISAGGVLLDGYDCGFIGGASGFDRKASKLYFCGDLMSHPDGKKIEKYAKEHGVDTVSLSDSALYDYGTLIFIP